MTTSGLTTNEPMPADAWQRRAMPVTRRLTRESAPAGYAGARLACWLHLVSNAVPLFEWLLGAGDVLFGSCDPTTADPAVVDHLRGLGARVLSAAPGDGPGHRAALAEAVNWRPDLVTEMGGELISALVAQGSPPQAAMESTTTGIHRISAVAPMPMPVLNWNDIPLKQLVEHRFHVAEALWAAFSALSGIGLLGRRVLVLGYGNVGKGVAAHARALGAIVTVAEPDPLRRVDARLHGCAVVGHGSLAAAEAEVVVTASGRDGSLSRDIIDRLPAGAILVNAGHAPAEIDLEHLGRFPSRELRPGVTGHVRPGGELIFVLGAASPLNLAYPYGSLGDDLWDPFNGVMVLGCRWLLNGSWRDSEPGFVEFPAADQRLLAELMLAEPAVRRGSVVALADCSPLDSGHGHELREVAGAHLPGSQQRHSLAHSTLEPGGTIPSHWHEVSEETFVIASGSGTASLDGVDTPVGTGHVVVVPPGVRHEFRAGAEGLSLWAASTPSWTPDDHHVDNLLAGQAG